MKILLAYGTRPEYIKIIPLLNVFKKNNIEYSLLFTGQQVNIGLFEYDYRFNISKYGNNRLDTIVKSLMNRLFRIKDITHVLVQGDTTSALAIALSAFHHKIKIIHLEAGLRTNDISNPYPEEANRRLISQIASIHLCPTDLSLKNLLDEKVLGEKYVVGNTVIDNLVQYKVKCEYTNKILVTLHRRENHEILDKWFDEINKLAIKFPEYEFILPIHPNPNVQKHKDILTNVNVVEPLPYDEMLNLLVKCRLVITDSGGLQEECSFFNKKCLTCRKTTERPEAIGQSTFMVDSPHKLSEIFHEHINNFTIDFISPFGDGNASEKIFNILYCR